MGRLCWATHSFGTRYQPEISNSNGATKITEDNPELAEWMDYRFWLDGIYSRDHFEFWGGLTVMSHPIISATQVHSLVITLRIFNRYMYQCYVTKVPILKLVKA